MAIASLLRYSSTNDIDSKEPVTLHIFTKEYVIPLGLYVRWANAYEEKNSTHFAPPAECFLFETFGNRGYKLKTEKDLIHLEKEIQKTTGQDFVKYISKCFEEYILS